MKPPPPPMPRTRWGGGWTQTGRYRWRPRLLFGPVLEVEMERDVWAPKVTGHSPINWRRETTWWKGEGWHSYEQETT